jgi:hypothetical protein
MSYVLNKEYYFVPNAGTKAGQSYFPCLNVNGNEQASNNRNVNIYGFSSSAKAQIWKVQNFSGGLKIVSKLSENYSSTYVLDYGRITGNVGNCDIYPTDNTAANNQDTCVALENYNSNTPTTNIYYIKLANHTNMYLTASGEGDGKDVRWANKNTSNNYQAWKLVEVNAQSDPGEPSTTQAVTGYPKYKVGNTLYSYDTVKPSVPITIKRSSTILSTTTTDVKITDVKESYNQRNTSISPSLAGQCYTCAIANMTSFLTGVDVSANWLSYNSKGFQGFNGVVNASILSHEISGLTQLSILKKVASLIDDKKLVLMHCTGYGTEHWVLVYGYKKEILNTTSISTASDLYTAFSKFNVKDSIITGSSSTSSLIGTDTDLAKSMAISLRETSQPYELVGVTITDLRYVQLNY